MPSVEFSPQRQNQKPTYIVLQAAAPQNVKPSYNAPASQNSKPTYYSPPVPQERPTNPGYAYYNPATARPQSSQFVTGLEDSNVLLDAAQGLVNLKKNLLSPLLAPLIGNGGGSSEFGGQQVRPSYGAPSTAPQAGYGVPETAPLTSYGPPETAPLDSYGVPETAPLTGYGAPETAPQLVFVVPASTSVEFQPQHRVPSRQPARQKPTYYQPAAQNKPSYRPSGPSSEFGSTNNWSHAPTSRPARQTALPTRAPTSNEFSTSSYNPPSRQNKYPTPSQAPARQPSQSTSVRTSTGKDGGGQISITLHIDKSQNAQASVPVPTVPPSGNSNNPRSPAQKTHSL